MKLKIRYDAINDTIVVGIRGEGETAEFSGEINIAEIIEQRHRMKNNQPADVILTQLVDGPNAAGVQPSQKKDR